jgi:hypothetical protein
MRQGKEVCRMLTRVEVFSQQPDAPELPLGGFMPNDDPVQIRSIDGLGPVKADISTTPFATSRGELYQGGSTGKRNIVMHLGLNPNWEEQTMSSLRQQLYRYLMPEQWTKLRFDSDELPRVDIEGYVESCDDNMFSDDPEVQVSIICPRPDFIEPDATILQGVVDDGTIETVFQYLGTVPTGFELRIDRSVDNPSYTGRFAIKMVSEGKDQDFGINSVTVDTDQYFKLNTVQGRRKVQSIGVIDGVATNLLASVDSDAVWPVIKPGENVFSVDAAENGQAWTLAYFVRLGGL